MSKSLLDLSGRIDPVLVEIFDTIASVAGARHIHYFVVGATARDMILSYGHGIAIRRATADIDLGVEVADWKEFNALKDWQPLADLRQHNQRKEFYTRVICRLILCRSGHWSLPTKKLAGRLTIA
jgi:predicted nucleotidyltransferase